MAIEQGNSFAMNNLGSYYYNIEKDYPKAIKYYLMAIDQGCDSNAIKNIKCIEPLCVYLYIVQSNYEATNPELVEWLNQLKTDPKIMSFINKKRIFTHSCDVCLETKLNIVMNCGHKHKKD